MEISADDRGNIRVESYVVAENIKFNNLELSNLFTQAASKTPEVRTQIESQLESFLQAYIREASGRDFKLVVDQVNLVLEQQAVYAGESTCCEYLYEMNDQVPKVMLFDARQPRDEAIDDIHDVFGKYKPVAKKVRPVKATLPQEFHVKRHITGDPLAGMPILPTNPPEFTPGERYTQERKEIIDKNHAKEKWWPEEMKLIHAFMKLQEKAFAWEASEGGNFRTDFFPPVKFPVLPHVPWVERDIPIPPGIREEVCRIIKDKIDAGVYEPSSSSYRSKWFTVIKKDGKSLRIVHCLEPLNKVTIQYSGVPPATAEVASQFAGRACIGLLDIWVGYDERYIDEESRDLTTFQTPFGPHRLVKLPMGWTNSVPIFHDDVCYIFRDEIPHITSPYVDDVSVRGPESQYKLPDGKFETIPENPGIRRFFWEHLNNVNRLCQRLKYVGGTFSGPKAFIALLEGVVLGFQVGPYGHRANEKFAKVVLDWDPELFEDKTDVKSLLGTAVQMRIYIKDYAKITRPLNKVSGANATFRMGDEEKQAVRDLQEAIRTAPCLRTIDYKKTLYLAVDTSWQAVGFYLYQLEDDNPKRKHFNLFGSIGLNEREARFSQPKRELYGLKMALEATYYYTYGCRDMIVETDASYIKGMLDNPSAGPNATINRWIEAIRKFHFELVHVKGATHGPDGLSRPPPGGATTERPPVDEEDYADEDNGEPIKFRMGDGEIEEPYPFEDFRNGIDSRGGYFLGRALSVRDFEEELDQVKREASIEALEVELALIQAGLTPITSFAQYEVFPPERDDQWQEAHPYVESHRTAFGKKLDDALEDIIKYISDEEWRRKANIRKEYRKFLETQSRHFFVDGEGRLYRRNTEIEGQHKLVVFKEKRMWMLSAAHDYLGHKGMYATEQLLKKRFWWPDMENDVNWFVRSCKTCQERQLRLIKAPPTRIHTPSLFQKIHIDVIKLSPASNGCKNVIHGRCALVNWSEARALKNERASSIAEWFFEDIICRWGPPEEVVCDNAPQMEAVMQWLYDKYGIRNIKISPYNSQANGKIERPHFDVRQALVKATGGDLRKWYWFLKPVLWADRATIRRGLGCSPYFLVTGAEPILPLDIVESTWLIRAPDRVLTHEELVGYRAQALAKHRTHVQATIGRVDKIKKDNLRKFEKEFKNKIKEYDFKPGQLVLMRNSGIEYELDRKMYPRYLGPMIVIRRTKGGSYILADMNGAVKKEKVGAFRVLPYISRYEPINLPENIHEIIDMSKEQLDRMLERTDDEDQYKGEDYIFSRIPHMKMPKKGQELVEEEEDSESEENANDSDEESVLNDDDQANGVRTRQQTKERQLAALVLG